ncbi:MAG: MFS transporter [Actinobacteria bacterium]|nr:MFS transporter [Actinomycetota bacterium]
MSRRPAGWYPLLVATASIGIANSVVFSLLSNLQDRYGFSDGGLGLIAGSGFLVGLIGQIVLAPFADRGHSKALLLAGLGAAVLGSVLFAMSASLITLVASRAVTGLSNSLFLPAARAIAISISPENVAERLGTMSGVELAGFVTGPVIGGFLVGPFGLKVPFLVTGAFALAGAALLAPRKLPQPFIDRESGEPRRLALDLLRLPRVRAGVLMSVALFLPVGFYDATLDVYLTDRGASDMLIGLTFLAYGIPFTLLATAGGRLSDRRGAVRVAFVSTMLVAPVTASYGLLAAPILILVLTVVEGCLQALGVPASQSMVAAAAPLGRAAAAQGLAGGSNLLIAAVTAYSAGTLYKLLGAAWLYSIAAGGVALFAILSLWQARVGRAAEAVATVALDGNLSPELS